MTRLLAALLGRLPIGWLQLSHSPPRMAAALAGVAFATVLVFVQLGIMGALNGTVRQSYAPIRADVLISSSNANTLTDGAPLWRRALYRALSDPGVAAAAPVHVGKLDWTGRDGSVAGLSVYGLPVEAARFAGPILRDRLADLALPDSALVDRRTRRLDRDAFADVTPRTPFRFEANGRTLSGLGVFALGGGFSADGAMIVSDQTFLRLFPTRISGTPSHVLVEPTTSTKASRRDRNVLMGLQVHGRGDPARQNAAAEHVLDLLGLGHRSTTCPAPCRAVRSSGSPSQGPWSRTPRSSSRTSRPPRLITSRASAWSGC